MLTYISSLGSREFLVVDGEVMVPIESIVSVDFHGDTSLLYTAIGKRYKIQACATKDLIELLKNRRVR